MSSQTGPTLSRSQTAFFHFYLWWQNLFPPPQIKTEKSGLGPRLGPTMTGPTLMALTICVQ